MLQRGAETSPLPSLSAPITKASRACRTPPLASYTSFTRFCSVCQTLKSMQRGKRRSERSRAEYAAGHSPATVRPGGTLSLAANRVGQHMYWPVHGWPILRMGLPPSRGGRQGPLTGFASQPQDRVGLPQEKRSPKRSGMGERDSLSWHSLLQSDALEVLSAQSNGDYILGVISRA